MLTHVDDRHLPTMVDVTEKKISQRVAKAQTLIQLPHQMKNFLQGEEFIMKKGPVFQTAIIAGTMARYAANGHIVYATASGTLMAAPFDVPHQH